MTFSPFMSIRISLPLSILSLTSLPGTYVPIGTLYRLLLYRIVLSFRTVLVTLSVGNDHKEGTGLKYCFSRANTSAGTFFVVPCTFLFAVLSSQSRHDRFQVEMSVKVRFAANPYFMYFTTASTRPLLSESEPRQTKSLKPIFLRNCSNCCV